MKKAICLLMLLGGLFLVVNPVLARSQPISKLPYTIKSPGLYYLTGNLNAASGAGIIVYSDDVTIDLLGFRLQGNTDNIAIHMKTVNDVAAKNVEVRNGTIRGWKIGVAASGLNGHYRVINIRVRDNSYGGIMLESGGNLIKDCTITDTQNAIWVGGGVVTGNVITNCSGGIWCMSLGASLPSSVIGNVVTNTGDQVGINLNDIAALMVDQNSVGDGFTFPGAGPFTVWGTNAGGP